MEQRKRETVMFTNTMMAEIPLGLGTFFTFKNKAVVTHKMADIPVIVTATPKQRFSSPSRQSEKSSSKPKMDEEEVGRKREKEKKINFFSH